MDATRQGFTDDMTANRLKLTSKNNRSTFLPAAVALTLLVAACGNGSPEAMLKSAKDFLAKNDAPAATIQLKNVLAKNPESGEARFLLGRALLDSGDAVAAEVELRKALDLKFAEDQVAPVLARAMLAQGQSRKLLDQYEAKVLGAGETAADLKSTLGQAHASLGQFDKARAAFEEALKSQPDYARAHLGLARLQAIQKDLPGALETVQAILAKSPQNADAWHFKADLLRASDKPDEAVEAYAKAIELNPKSLAAHAAIIMTYLGQQKAELAAKQFEAMEKVAPKHPQTIYMRALLAYGKKDWPAAKTAVESLLKAQPNSPLALQMAGVVAFQTGSDLQAQEYLGKALNTAPGLDFGRRILTLSYLRARQPAKALATLKPVLHGDETNPSWNALAGSVYMQNGEAQLAEEFFARAAKADPKNARSRTALALARMQLGHSEQAFAELEEIAAGDDGVTADMVLISSALRQRQIDKALKAIARLEKKQPDNPMVFNLRGNTLAAKGDIKGARESFEQALRLNPAYFPAAASLARIDLAEKKPEDALKRFDAVLAKDPKNVSALLASAELRLRSGAKPDEVSGILAKAIAAAPDDPAPRTAQIQLYMALKDNDKAVAAVRDALAALPDKPEILDLAGRVMQQAGDTNQALAHYTKLATLLPNAAGPYLRMAEIQLATKNKESARASINKGLAAQPDSIALHRVMVMIDLDAGRFAEALSRARELQKTHPKENAGFVIAGDVLVAQKAWGEAANAYRAGLKITENSTDLAQRLYVALSAGGQAAESTRFADSWLKAHPKDAKFRAFLADMANNRKDYASAVTQYRALLADQPKNPALLNNLAWSLGQLHDPKAVSYAEEANKLAPNQPAIMDTLGMLLADKGEVERALELLRSAVERAPQVPDVRLNLARVLIKANKKADARKELETLAKLGDKFASQAEVSKLLQGL